MALRFIDGASGYDTAHAGEKWSNFSVQMTVTLANGRRSSPSLRASNWSGNVQKVLDAQPTWILGFAFNVAALPAATRQIASVIDTATVQCSIALNPTGTISAFRGSSGGTLLGTSSVVITPGIYSYIEVLFTVNNTTGVITVRKDGVTILNLTAQNTRSTANNFADLIMFLQNSSESATIDIDDIYVLDATGPFNNAFLGDCRVDNTVPNGAGALTAWSPFSASPNFLNVDDGLVNDDTDYNFTSTPGARDLYDFPNIAPTVGAVFGVAVNLTVRKEDATARTFRALVRSGVTNYPGSTIFSPTTSYVRYCTPIYETDPNTAAAWTIANVNAAQFGIDLVS